MLLLLISDAFRSTGYYTTTSIDLLLTVPVLSTSSINYLIRVDSAYYDMDNWPRPVPVRRVRSLPYVVINSVLHLFLTPMLAVDTNLARDIQKISCTSVSKLPFFTYLAACLTF
jgi:hypothetical protein